MTYRPQSPDLSSSYAPQSPDLSGYRPQSPDLSGLGSPAFAANGFNQIQSQQRQRFQNSNGFGGYGAVTSTPQFQPQFQQHPHHQQQQHFHQLPPTSMGRMKTEPDDEYMPDAAAPVHRGPGRPRKHPMPLKQEMQYSMHQQPRTDPTLGVTLKTSFPVARIKRIMQADEDIGKVAQVTPHVVSRALELFMIKLISASAEQARGGAAAVKAEGGSGGGGKGPRRVLAQHMKKAVMDNETFDFLQEIVGKVPDAPTAKSKKDVGSESDESAPVGKKKGGGKKKRKDSGDDF